MSHKNSDSASVASAAPLSPFSSTLSSLSEVTSDDTPDLGAFNTVFRALSSSLQPPVRATAQILTASESESYREGIFDDDSDTNHSTVWNHDPIRSYLSSGEENPIANHTDDELASDTEEDEAEIRPIHVEEEEDGPSLGILDSALVFLAAERARLSSSQKAVKDDSDIPTPSGIPWRQVISPRRRRRRKRRPSKGAPSGQATIVPTPDLSYSSAEQSSSPPRPSRMKRIPGLLNLSLSRSTPNLLLQSIPEDPHLTQLQQLRSMLIEEFPQERKYLRCIPRITEDEATGESFIDTRGRSPFIHSGSSIAPPVNVFIDHSNILVGFLSFMKRSSQFHKRKLSNKLQMSHAALSLILERGRQVTRRVIVASSPLHQPMRSAEQLGYEVQLFARVPDTREDSDRVGKRTRGSSPPEHSSSYSPQSMDSDPSPIGSKRQNKTHNHTRTSSSSALASTLSIHQQLLGPSTGPAARNARIRYKEQGVDELLQLKVYQAILAVDRPPNGSTIVLATGDGNHGQFNGEGFLGCVETALKKGWLVELYAWEDGLSRAWARSFGDNPRFRIIGLEKFGPSLQLP